MQIIGQQQSIWRKAGAPSGRPLSCSASTWPTRLIASLRLRQRVPNSNRLEEEAAAEAGRVISDTILVLMLLASSACRATRVWAIVFVCCVGGSRCASCSRERERAAAAQRFIANCRCQMLSLGRRAGARRRPVGRTRRRLATNLAPCGRPREATNKNSISQLRPTLPALSEL